MQSVVRRSREGGAILEYRQDLKDGFVLRSAAGADRAAILALINLVQPNLPWTPEHFDWQLMQGPAGPAAVRVIETGGRIVSLYVGTRKRLWFKGAVREAVMVQDVLTDPEFRGRGFLNQLATSFLAEMRSKSMLGYTFPNKLSENSFRRSGWTELCRIPAITRSLPADVRTARGSDVALREVEAFGDAVGDIWRQAGLRIAALRDGAFLGWRYRRPETVYRRFIIGENSGYAVLKLYRRDDRNIMHVCDLVLRETERQLLRPVLEDVFALAAEAGATLLTAWVTVGHPYRSTFEAAGFRPDESNDRFAFVTGPESDLTDLANPAAWHLSQGDSDVY